MPPAPVLKTWGGHCPSSRQGAAHMMVNDLHGKAVLVTGGTMGIGLATGLAFGTYGARCILTHKWGTADEDEVRARFAEIGAPEPMIVQADVSNAEDTSALLDAIKA